MHEEYGPIVRINPYELHVDDPSFISKLYPNTAKNVEKWPWSAGMFGSTGMAFSTINHDLHRLRSGAFRNFFSKQSIRTLEPVINQIVEQLCHRLERNRLGEAAIDMVLAYSALTHDIITEYCFSNCSNWLLQPDFAFDQVDAITKPAESTHLIKQFPLMLPLIDLLPDWVVRLAHPLAAQLRKNRAGYERQVDSILRGVDKPLTASHPTIFHSLRADPNLPPSEKTKERLAMEAQSIIGAGSVSSAQVLSSITYHVLANPSILLRLLSELETAIPDATVPASLADLERLPYLTAVIYEGLRIGHGIVHRLQRVHPDTTLRYGPWAIPAGTPVGMTSLLIHSRPDIFPSPRTFNPDRWLAPNSEKLLRYLFSFGKGTRQCVGQNLAYAELYITIATVFRRFGRKARLFETDRERDVDVLKDFFVASPSLESRGVRIVIQK